MGFSLRKLLGETLNPFDGPKKVPATTAPSRLSTGSSLSVGAPRQQTLQPASTAQPRTPNLIASAAKPMNLIAGSTVIPQSPTLRTEVFKPKVAAPSIVNQLIQKNPAASAAVAGISRSLVGTGQAGAGLYDLLSPGTGTNRLSKSFDRAGKAVDRTVQQQKLPTSIYRPTQAVGDALQFAIGGGELKAAAKAAPFIGRAAEVVQSPAVKLADNLAQKGFKGRVAANAVRGATDPRLLAANAGQQAFYTGQDASRGEDINPLSQAGQFAISQVGLPVAGSLAKETVIPAARAAESGLRNTGIIAPSRLNPSEVGDLSLYRNAIGTYNMTDDLYARGQQAAQKAGINVQDPATIDSLLNSHLTYNTQREAMRSPAVAQGGYVNLGKNGFDDLSPQQNEFINDYSEMLRQVGEGNGVDITADGRRVSNNFRSANDKGKSLTAADWLDRARAEIESGKAGFGASDEYALLPKSQLDIPEGFGAPSIAAGAAKKPTTQLVSKAPVAPTTKLVRGTVENGEASLPKVTANSFTAKVDRQNITPEAQKLVSGNGNVRNTQQLADEAIAATKDLKTADLTNQANERLAVKLGSIGDDDVAFTQQAIERAGMDGDFATEAALHDSLSEHLRKKGQDIQAASLFYKLSPNGMYYKARKDLKKALPKEQFTPEMDKNLRSLTKAVKDAKTPDDKAWAQAILQKYVADNLPQKTSQQILSVWKAGLLSGVKTQGGNFLSNGTFAGLKAASSPLAAGIDKALSIGTGQRTKTATLSGYGKGFKEGVGKGVKTLKTGVDERNMVGDKYEVYGELNFKNKVLQKVVGAPTNLVFRGMSSADQPFYFAALRNSLADQAKAQGINKGLKGSKLTSYVKDAVANPPLKLAEQANQEAWKAVLGQDNKLASKISSLTRDYPVAGVLVPFVKVPTNFLVRTLDYTPAGYVKGAVKTIKSLKAGEGIPQRQLSEAIAEATTGTALIYLGSELANNGLLSGQYPSGDQKEAQRWKAEGITPNSVKVGNKWISLNYLGPAGLLFGAGKDYQEAASRGDNATASSIAGVGKNLTGQSFLSGLSGFADAINDPQREAKSFVNSQAASVVPSWVNDIANLKDVNQRDAQTIGESVKNRLPIARESNRVKQDVYGNELKQAAGRPNTINPLKPSNDIRNKNTVVSEVGRLRNVDRNNKDLEVTPTTVDKKIKIEGEQVKLTDKQRYDLQKQVGQQTQKYWGELIKTPEYKALSDIEKAQALSKLRTDVAGIAQRQYVVDNNVATYSKAATKKQQKIATGMLDVAAYAGKKEATTAKATKSPKTKVGRASGKKRSSSGGRSKGINSKTFTSSLIAATQQTNKAASSNQKALQNLLKGARVTAKSSGKKLATSNVQLKKQSAKKKRVKA